MTGSELQLSTDILYSAQGQNSFHTFQLYQPAYTALSPESPEASLGFKNSKSLCLVHFLPHVQALPETVHTYVHVSCWGEIVLRMFYICSSMQT